MCGAVMLHTRYDCETAAAIVLAVGTTGGPTTYCCTQERAWGETAVTAFDATLCYIHVHTEQNHTFPELCYHIVIRYICTEVLLWYTFGSVTRSEVEASPTARRNIRPTGRWHSHYSSRRVIPVYRPVLCCCHNGCNRDAMRSCEKPSMGVLAIHTVLLLCTVYIACSGHKSTDYTLIYMSSLSCC